MRTLALILFSFTFFSNFLLGQCADWQSAPSGTTAVLRAVHFPDAQNGWVVGGRGTILRSTNGGQTWSSQNAQLDANGKALFSVHFANSTTGWVVGGGGFVKKTTDGGNSWVTQNVNTNADLFDVFFTDANKGCIVGACGSIFITTNGGTQWTSVNSGQNAALNAVAASNANNFAIASSSTTFLHSSNSGNSWSPASSSGFDRNFRALAFFGANGWAANGLNKVRKSVNGGSSWQAATSPSGSNVWQSASASDANTVWLAGLAGKLVTSTNGGSTWTDFSSGIGTEDLYGLQMLDSETGWAVGADGKIFRLSCAAACDAAAEKTNLEKIYTATNGSTTWQNKTNWLSAQPLNTWYGIQTNANGCVEQILLADNGLTGSLPTGLSFPELKNLNFGGGGQNQITGSVPTDWTLPLVEFVNFSSNKLTGNIPNLNFPKLKEIFFSNNQLNGTVANPTLSPDLEKYHFHTNPLAGTIPALTAVPKLKELSAFNCNFSGFATQTNFINSAQPFQLIELEGNQFTFEDLLPNLTTINFTGNASEKSYSPQDSVFAETTFSKNVGETLTIDLGFDAAVPNNSYQWFKNGAPWGAPSNSNKLVFNNLQVSDAGEYHVRVTNSDAPQLTLFGRKIEIKINPVPAVCLTDSLELVKLFNATGGQNWTNKTNWLVPGQPISTWYGIQTDVEGCVAYIDMDGNIDFNGGNSSAGNGLTGSLPNLNLPKLQGLYCSLNKLTGVLPNFNLPNLQNFFCYGNQLNGVIPDFNLPNLQNFFCFNNQLTGSIPNFSNLPKLQNLYAYYNQLTGSIPNFSNLNNLQNLHCYGNQLTGSIPDFSNLPSLRSLLCYNNQLTGNIPNFSNLPNIEALLCSNNLLSGGIPDFSNLPNLVNFQCHANDLIGKIPNFSNLPNLEILWCHENQLDEDVPNFSNLPKLLDFHVHQNQLTFENILPNLPAIQNKIAQNGQSCVWCDYIYAPQDSVFAAIIFTKNAGDALTIDLGFDAAVPNNSYQWFKNGLPWTPPAPNISTSNKLTFNSLSLSDAAVYYVQVTNPSAPLLTLFGRKIEIKINAVPTVCPNDSLELVKLFNATGGQNWTNKTNWLVSGKPISTWFGVSVNVDGCVTCIDLDGQHNCAPNGSFGNSLSGTLPALSFPELTHLSLRHSDLTGNLPTMTGVPKLKQLFLGFSQFNGSIDPCLDLLELEFLDLSVNKFSGNIPKSVANLSKLQYFNLRGNELGGLVPDEICQLKSLNSLILGFNQFAGDFPSCFANTTAIGNLYLNSNQFTALPDPTKWVNIGNGSIPTVGIARNALTFEDVIPYVQMNFPGITGLEYMLQDSVFVETTLTRNVGDNLDFSLDFDENVAGNIYRWFKNGTFQFQKIGNNDLEINGLKLSDSGIWQVEVTNPAAPLLTLFGRKIEIKIGCTTPPNISAQAGKVPCSGGGIVLNGGSTTPGATFSWSGPSGFSSNSEDPTATEAGTYFLTVTDSGGCTASTSVVVSAALPPTLVATALPFSCDLPNGGATLQISGATGSPTFLWSNGSTNPSLQNVAGGSFSVTVTDPATNCTATASVNITGTSKPTVAATAKPADCNQNTGAVTLSLSNATAPTFLWSNNLTTQNLQNLPAGVYTVTVTSQNGCTATASATVTATDAPILTATASPTRCDQPTGSITLNLSGAIGTPTFSWSNNLTTQNLQNLPTGNFTVTVTNGNGCTTVTAATVVQLPAPTASATASGVLDCNSTMVGLLGNSNASAAQFSWSGPANFSSNLKNPTVGAAGQYFLTVTDDATSGCTATASVTVSSDGTAPSAANLKLTQPTCFGKSDGSLEVQGVTGGTAPYLYALGNQNFGSNGMFGDLSAGVFSLKIQDSKGCEFSQNVELVQPALLILDLGSKKTAEFGTPVQIDAPAGFAKYVWSTGASGQNLEVSPPVGTHVFSLTVSDAAGCTARDEIDVEIQQNGLPPHTETDVITPNGDGLNETFIIEEIENHPQDYPNCEFSVYNRWGDLVFFKKGYDNSWGGTNQSGTALPEGTYFYVIELKSDKGFGFEIRRGAVLVIR